MPAVRRTIHLAYTMGHTAGSGAGLRDDDVAAQAVRLARRLHALRPDDSEATGLLALVLLTEARAATRLDAGGAQVLLADADRRCWDRDLIAEGLALVADQPRGPLRSRRRSPPSTPGPRRWTAPTGARSSTCTTDC